MEYIGGITIYHVIVFSKANVITLFVGYISFFENLNSIIISKRDEKDEQQPIKNITSKVKMEFLVLMCTRLKELSIENLKLDIWSMNGFCELPITSIFMFCLHEMDNLF